MTWRLVWTDNAQKSLRKLRDNQAAARIVSAVERLANDGQGDVRALRGAIGQFRLRVGTHRVRFERDGEHLVITVIDVAPRREAYRARR